MRTTKQNAKSGLYCQIGKEKYILNTDARGWMPYGFSSITKLCEVIIMISKDMYSGNSSYIPHTKYIISKKVLP